MDQTDMNDWKAEMSAMDEKRNKLIVSLAKEGYTAKQISSIFNRHISSIQDTLRERGIKA